MRVLVAYDGTDGAEAALRHAARLAAAADGSLFLLHVLDPHLRSGDELSPARRDELAQDLAREQARLAERVAALEGVRAEVLADQAGPGEHVGQHIVRVATEREADTIVVASRRAAGVTGMLLGSVAQEVLRLAPMPVLVVRPRR